VLANICLIRPEPDAKSQKNDAGGEKNDHELGIAQEK